MRRFVFVTGHEFGVAAFQRLMACESFQRTVECSLLIGLDPKKERCTSGFFDIGKIAQRFEVPFKYVSSIKSDEAYATVLRAAPDLIFVIGWSELAPPTMLDIPMQVGGHRSRHGQGHGCIGMHPTLLPQGRGRAPIPWTIIRGLDRSGVTAFMLEETPDSGPIVDQVAFEISPIETSTTLFAKALRAHETLADRIAISIANSTISFVPQDESRASLWPKRRLEDSLLDFQNDAHFIERFVRALSRPYPPAFTWIAGQKVEIHSVEVTARTSNTPPGVVQEVESNGTPIVSTGSSLIRIVSFTPGSFAFREGQRMG